MKNTLKLAVAYATQNKAQAWLEFLATLCGVSIVGLLYIIIA